MTTRIISGQRKDLGGFSVARLLPQLQVRSLGPFVFLDHIGPARLPPGTGIDVRAHPHIGLATVTYLYSGALMHRDSLGSAQEIRPGDVNWMNAGSGIVHSERTPEALRLSGSELHGLQAWVALPQADEESAPAFDHYPSAQLPCITAPGLRLHLIAGAACGERSPVRVYGELFYLAGELQADADWTLPELAPERALYLASGELDINGTRLVAGQLLVLEAGSQARIAAPEHSRIAILGGAPLDSERHMWWNFVSSRRERIERAKADWQAGRFAPVPGESEVIPLPEGH